jgi:hypothetical protein
MLHWKYNPARTLLQSSNTTAHLQLPGVQGAGRSIATHQQHFLAWLQRLQKGLLDELCHHYLDADGYVTVVPARLQLHTVHILPVHLSVEY